MSKVALPKAIIFLACLLLACNSAICQSVPTLMNYQGHLTNATGQPLANGQYTLTFNVYNVPTGGTAVWGPQAIAAEIVDGYFNVVLSTDSTGGDSITTAFTAQPRYVAIRVNAAAEILPRQQVLSAPFAIQADRAAAADVASSTIGTANVFPGAGNVGIGTTTPDRELSVTGTSLFNGDVDVAGAGTLNTAGAANIGGRLTVEMLQTNRQKVCRTGVTNTPIVHIMPVPALWTGVNCRDLTGNYTGNNYALGCFFGDGSTSMGAVVAYTEVAPAPNPNCGW
jgi:hypothetical protein